MILLGATNNMFMTYSYNGSPEAYSTIPQWIKDAKDLARPDISIILVGNKSDLKDNRAVPFLDAAKFAQEYGLSFIETSALTGENVSEAFNLLARTILNKIESGMKVNWY